MDEIQKGKVQAAYKDACESVKAAFERVFGKEAFEETAKPTLDDYKTIKSYEDACIALGIEPIKDAELIAAGCEPHHIALMKLEVVSRALWGKNFRPQPNAEGNESYYYPWFYLYTKNEIEDMDEENRKSMLGALLAGLAAYGSSAGFGFLNTHGRSSSSGAHSGFRLCQETSEKAKYFGKQFIELWAEYLAYGFTVTGHLE